LIESCKVDWNFRSSGLAAIALLVLLLAQAGAEAQPEPRRCTLGPTSSISSLDQARCLLREPKLFGEVGPRLTGLPVPLGRLMTMPVIEISKDQFRAYLVTHGIRESEIGGSLDRPVSRTNNNDPGSDLARYLIIHDTSTPNLGAKPFPEDINKTSWKFNDFARYGSGAKSPSHVIINRLGQSVTRVDFGQPWRSTAFESNAVCGINRCKGLFLGVELVQPRRCKGTVAACGRVPPVNDAIAPEPGFSNSQLERLAVVYVAASLRRGKWLIPAFHVSLDQEVGDHDDPQNFRLDDWARQLDAVITAVKAGGVRP
jgi:hypothetical protein